MVGCNVAQAIDCGIQCGVFFGKAQRAFVGWSAMKGGEWNGGNAVGAGPFAGPVAVVAFDDVAGIEDLEEPALLRRGVPRRGPFKPSSKRSRLAWYICASPFR